MIAGAKAEAVEIVVGASDRADRTKAESLEPGEDTSRGGPDPGRRTCGG